MEKRYVVGFHGELSTEFKSGKTYFVEAEVHGAYEFEESDISEIVFEQELPDWWDEWDKLKYEANFVDTKPLGYKVHFMITCKNRESINNFIKRAKGIALEILTKAVEEEDKEYDAERNATLYIRSYVKDDKLMKAEVFPYSEAPGCVVDMCEHNEVDQEDGVYTVYFQSKKSINTTRIEGISRMYIAKSKGEF